MAGVQIHSLRRPGYTVSTEIIFGNPDERLHFAMRLDRGPTSRAHFARGAPGHRTRKRDARARFAGLLRDRPFPAR